MEKPRHREMRERRCSPRAAQPATGTRVPSAWASRERRGSRRVHPGAAARVTPAPSVVTAGRAPCGLAAGVSALPCAAAAVGVLTDFLETWGVLFLCREQHIRSCQNQIWRGWSKSEVSGRRARAPVGLPWGARAGCPQSVLVSGVPILWRQRGGAVVVRAQERPRLQGGLAL